MTTTNHASDIEWLRTADKPAGRDYVRIDALDRLAADLLEIHDATGISLDDWPAAREFVEALIGHPITENHV